MNPGLARMRGQSAASSGPTRFFITASACRVAGGSGRPAMARICRLKAAHRAGVNCPMAGVMRPKERSHSPARAPSASTNISTASRPTRSSPAAFRAGWICAASPSRGQHPLPGPGSGPGYARSAGSPRYRMQQSTTSSAPPTTTLISIAVVDKALEDQRLRRRTPPERGREIDRHRRIAWTFAVVTFSRVVFSTARQASSAESGLQISETLDRPPGRGSDIAAVDKAFLGDAGPERDDAQDGGRRPHRPLAMPAESRPSALTFSNSKLMTSTAASEGSQRPRIGIIADRHAVRDLCRRTVVLSGQDVAAGNRDGHAAMADMRPSWPPPTRPMVALGGSGNVVNGAPASSASGLAGTSSAARAGSRWPPMRSGARARRQTARPKQCRSSPGLRRRATRH